MEPDLFDMDFEDRISGSGMYPDPTEEGVEDPFWNEEDEGLTRLSPELAALLLSNT